METGEHSITQAVILAAGRGVRMGELTDLTPKPLLQVRGKTLLEYKLESLPDSVTEVLIVVGYMHKKIREALGKRYRNRQIRYVEMEELNGTEPALRQCQPYLRGRFLVLMGDDIYAPDDIARCAEERYALLVSKVEHLERGGKVIFSHEGTIECITEGPHDGSPGFVNAGLYALTPEIFRYPPVRLPNGEFGLPQTFLQMSTEVQIIPITATQWHQITAPEDLERVANHL